MNLSAEEPNIESQRTYYNEYWRSHKLSLIPDEVARLSEILKAFAQIMPSFAEKEIRICDLGCGRGWLSAELSKFGKVTGVDLSQDAVLAANQRWPQVGFHSVDILTWRPDEAFDIVVSSEVIEHVPNHRLFADTVQYLLRDGGYLILTTPNGGVKSAWDRGNHSPQIIENWLSVSQIRKLFASFEVISQKVFIFDFAYVGLFRITSAPKFLKIIKKIGVLRAYDFMREILNLGLYQIFIGKLNSAKNQ